MSANIKNILTGCLVKFTSVADKSKDDIITKEKSHELLLHLLDDTCGKILRRRIDSFRTNN